MGENGSGKTSTLRASLLFFGSRPGDIAKAKGDTFEGFATFYFPRLSSYLVYEYERAGELLCVVCSAKNGQVQYQFMNTAFDESFFLYKNDNKEMIAPTAQLRINVEHKGFELSRKMGPDVYADIIQSNKPYRSKNGSYELIRQLRPRFSLPTKGGSIHNVDRVLANIFSSKASVAHIQSALTNILIQDKLIPSKTLKLDEQSGSINEWFSSRDAWLSLDARRENIIGLCDAASKYQAILLQLGSLHHRCQILLKTQTDKLDSLDSDITTTTNKESEARIKLNTLREKHSAELVEIVSQIETLARQSKNLEDIKSDFEVGSDKNQPISDLKVISAKLVTYQQQEVNLHQIYTEVSNGVQDIVSFYESQYAQIRTLISELEKNTQTLISESQTNQHNEINKSSELFKQKQQGLLTLRDQRRQTLGDRIIKFEQKSASLKSRLLDFSFSAEYRESISRYEEEIKTADKDFQDALSDNRRISKTLTTQKDERRRISELNVELKIKRQTFIEEQNSIRSRIENGTLFDYLQENSPDFEATIGKVINPELLSMKGLEPNFTEVSDNMFGLTLNLDAIAPPVLLNKNDLHNRIISLDESIADIDEKIEENISCLAKQNEQVRKTESAFARSEIELNEAQRYLTEQKQSAEQEKDKAKVQLKGRHEQDKIDSINCNTELGTLRNEDRQIKATYEADMVQLSKDEEIKANQISTGHNNNVTKLKQDLDESVKAQIETINNLEEKKAKDIKEKGLSPERIEEALKTYRLAQENVRRSTRAGERVSRYETFMNSEWLNHQSISIALENSKQEKKNFVITSEQNIEKHVATLNGLTNAIAQINTEFTRVSNEKRTTGELIEELSDIESNDSKTELFDVMDINQCKVRYSKLKADFDAHKSKGKNEFNILERAFCKTTGTPTRKFYEKMRNELLKNHQGDELWWSSAPNLAEYIEKDHVTQADFLRSNYILVAKQIADFSYLITSTHKSLNTLGRKLTTTTKSVVERFDAIGRIEIRVSSKLKNLSYFSALESFSKAHEHWTIQNSNQLPDDALISKLTNLIDMIGNNRLEINVDKSFAFEVELEDNGTLKRARTDEEIETLSSTGLSYLIITAIYIGLINLLRTDPDIHLLFCVDEVGKLSKNNTGKLISLFERYNISIYSALPDADAELLQYYPLAYQIIKTGNNSRQYKLYGDESRITTHSKITNLINNSTVGE